MEPIEILVILLAILIGMFVVAPSLIKNDEDAQRAIAQMREYEGWVGVVVAIFGVVSVIVLIFNHGWWLLFPLSVIAAAIILTVLGFLLGYQLISEKVLANNEGAKEKAEAFRARWEPKQNMLGWAVVILGVAALILYALR